MNLFWFLAYVLMLAILVLLAALAAFVVQLAGAAAMTPEIQLGLTVLIIVILVAILILIFLLCLARAKDRLTNEKRLYRLAHGDELQSRSRAEQLLAELTARDERGLRNWCDVLVRRKFPRPCLQLPIEVTRRPDPCIYSQFFLMANGQPVTWDNPNIEVLLGGVPQDTYNLQRSTNYQVQVGIENASPFFAALNTQIQVNLLTFGIGGPTPSPMHSFVKSIPAGTSFPGVPEIFPWTSPSQEGHYCIQVLITHPVDVNPSNNEGWNNTIVQGVQAGESMRLSIPVWNALRFGRRGRTDAAKNTWQEQLADVRLTLDSYVLPRDQLPARDLDVLFAAQPVVWNATVTPTRMTIPPGTQTATDAEFAVRVPTDAPLGTRATFNVSGTAGGRPLGGVTIHLDVK